MSEVEWIDFFKKYYAYHFDTTIENQTNYNIKLKKKFGLEPQSFEEELEITKNKRYCYEKQILRFVEENYKLLNCYLELGFSIGKFEHENYLGTFERKKLVKNLVNGFNYEIVFHITESIDMIDVILHFVNNGKVSSIYSAFNMNTKSKLEKELVVLFNEAININGEDLIERK